MNCAKATVPDGLEFEVLAVFDHDGGINKVGSVRSTNCPVCCPVAKCCERTTTATGATITWTHSDDYTTRPNVTYTPGTHATGTVPTKVTAVITTEECVCVDDNGIDRYYGEVVRSCII